MPNPQPMPGVSVVIPCYNYAHYLRHAVDSVLAQTYVDREIIIVDDGSTDDTPAVAAAYGDRVRVIRQPNAGLPAARNTGIRAASKPFIALLDADDVWLPGYLSAVMTAFARLPDDTGLVASKSIKVGPAGNILGRIRRDHEAHGELRARDILLRTHFAPSTVTVRKAVFEACGLFDDTLTSSEDRDMWIRVGMRFRLFLLPDALVHIRDHPSSMSKNAERMARNTRAVIRKARRAGVVPARDVTFWLRVMAFNRFQCAWMYRDQRRHLRAVAEMAMSLVFWPWFGCPEQVNEPALFRVRALRRFLWEAARG